MTKKEKELLTQYFSNAERKIFEDNKSAEQVHEILKKLNVQHDFGSFEQKISFGKYVYKKGITIKEPIKLKSILKEADYARTKEKKQSY